MDRLRILFFFIGCGFLTLLSMACPFTGPQYPVIYGNTPTPTPPPAAAVSLVVGSPYSFSPQSVTIRQGGSVTFIDTTGFNAHTVYVDNTTGTCIANSAVPPNGSIIVTAPFVALGTFHYHCSIHSPCGTT